MHKVKKRKKEMGKSKKKTKKTMEKQDRYGRRKNMGNNMKEHWKKKLKERKWKKEQLAKLSMLSGRWGGIIFLSPVNHSQIDNHSHILIAEEGSSSDGCGWMASPIFKETCVSLHPPGWKRELYGG